MAENGVDAACRAAAALAAFRPVLDAASVWLGVDPPGGGRSFRVLILREGTFEDVVPRERRGVLAGFARHSVEGGNVVVRADAPESTLRHEAVHVFLNERLHAQPLWVSEGLADLLAGAVAQPDAIVIGPPPDGALEVLRRGPRPTVRELLDAGEHSAVYAPGDAQRIFGAMSWLLVHRLLVAEGGVQRLGPFLSALVQGEDRVAAFTRAFVVTPEQLDVDLAASLAAEARPVVRLPGGSLERFSVSDHPSLVGDSELALGRLLLSAGRSREASRWLDRAVELTPSSAAAHELLAEARLRERKLPEARRLAEAARRLDPTRAGVLVRLARVVLQEAYATEDADLAEAERSALALVEDALARAPHDAEAIELRARLDPHPAAVRSAELAAALAREPDRGDLGITLAGLLLGRFALPEAAAVLRQVRERSGDESLSFIAGHMLTRVEASLAGTRTVRGRLTLVECRKAAPLRFHLRDAGGAEVVLTAGSSTSFLLFDQQGEAGERTFQCGRQDVGAVAWHRPLADGTSILLSLTLSDQLQAP